MSTANYAAVRSNDKAYFEQGDNRRPADWPPIGNVHAEIRSTKVRLKAFRGGRFSDDPIDQCELLAETVNCHGFGAMTNREIELANTFVRVRVLKFNCGTGKWFVDLGRARELGMKFDR